MTADLLRRAADRIEQRGANVTPGRWDYDRFADDEPYEVVVEPPTGDVLTVLTTATTEHAKANALWVSTLGPQVAAPLAAWLRTEAEASEDRVTLRCPSLGVTSEAAALARMILGESPG